MERPLVSVHAVDIARGIPAAGLRLELFRRDAAGRTSLALQIADRDGKAVIGPEVVSARDLPCRLTLELHLAEFYRDLSPDPFVTVAPFNFTLADPSCHHHLPAKITPFGLSLFITRSGGAKT